MRVKLKDVCTFYTGTGFPKKYQGQLSGTYPFYKVGDIANNVVSGKVYLEQCNNYISEETLELIKGSIVPKNTVVFAKIGEALKLNRRAITSTDCLIDNNAMGIAAKSDELRTLFFYYFMRNIKMELLAESTTVPSVRKSRLEAYEIDIPSLDEQEIIERKLTILSRMINLKEKQLLKLDELVKARFVEMFGDPITNDRLWDTVKLNDVCDGIGDGLHGTPEYDEYGHYPFINGNNLKDGMIEVTPSTKMVNEDTYRKHFIKLTENSILLSINGTLGNLALYNGEKVMLGKSACYCNLIPNINRIFVAGIMRTDAFSSYLESNATASTIKNVGLKVIREFMLIVPPLELQNQFASFVEEIDKSRLLSNHSLFLIKSIIF